MNGTEKFNKIIHKYPHPHTFITERPFLTRRRFFQAVGTAEQSEERDLRAADRSALAH
jgi:hypothetical protein